MQDSGSYRGSGLMVQPACFSLLPYTGRCKHAFVKTSYGLAGTNEAVFLYKIRCFLFFSTSYKIIQNLRLPPKEIRTHDFMLENDIEFYDVEKDIEYYDIDFVGKELGIQIKFIGFWISLFAMNTY